MIRFAPIKGSGRAAAAGVMVASLSLAACPTAAMQPVPLEDARLLSVRVENTEIEPALDALIRDGVIYLPIVRLVELTEHPHEVTPDGRLLVGEGVEIALTPGDGAVVEDGIPFIALDRAQSLLSIRLDAEDQADVLRISPAGDAALPVAERLRREAVWRRLPEPIANDELPRAIDPPYVLYAPLMGDVTLTARHDSDGGGQIDYNGLLVGELAWLTHEFYVSGRADQAPDDLRLRSGRRSYSGGVFGVDSLYEALAGDVFGYTTPLVGRSGIGRGLSLTGRPPTQPTDFDVTRIEGDAPPGWDVELYRNGELLAIMRVGPDGRYRFEDAPLMPGRNQMVVRFYGPQGQMREESRAITVGADTPAPGAVYWAAFLNQPDQRLLSGLLDRRARYDDVAGAVLVDLGVARNLSLGAFAARAPEGSRAGSRFSNYGGVVVRSALGAASMETAVAARDEGGWAWRVAALAGVGPVGVAIRHEAYLDDYRSLDAEAGSNPLKGASRIRLSVPLSNIAEGLGVLSVSAERLDMAEGGRETSARVNWRASWRAVRFDHGLEHRSLRLEDGSTQDETYYVGAATVSRGRLSARAAMRHSLSGGSQTDIYEVGLQHRISERLVLSAGVFRDQVERTSGGNVGLSRDLGFAFLNIGATWRDDGGYSIGGGLTFSFGFDSGGRARFASRPQAQMGALEPFVFLDRGGDGRYQPGVDRVLSDVQLLVNSYPLPAARTAADGRAWIPAPPAGQTMTVGVETGSLPDAFFVPAIRAFAVAPRAGRVMRLDIPIVETGEISGRVEVNHEAGAVAVGGFRLELVDEQGEVKATTTTMFDGLWLFDQVPPGRWIVRTAAGQRIGEAMIAPAFVHTAVNAQSLIVDGIGFRLDARGGAVVSVALAAEQTTTTEGGANP